jgi:hypothetical protein
MKTLDAYSSKLPQLRLKRSELFANAAKHRAECAEIRARLQNAPLAGNEQEHRVLALLGETSLKSTTPPDTERLDELLRALTDLNAATGIIDSQIEVESRIASTKLCEAIAPQHAALAKDYAKKLNALHAADLAYNAFLDSVEDTGAQITSLNRVNRSWLGHPKDVSSGYRYALHELAEAKYISKTEIHEAIR